MPESRSRSSSAFIDLRPCSRAAGSLVAPNRSDIAATYNEVHRPSLSLTSKLRPFVTSPAFPGRCAAI